jgi:hypothetical protein
MTIVNDDCVINKLEALLTDDARVVIYNRYMFMVQATGIILDDNKTFIVQGSDLQL